MYTAERCAVESLSDYERQSILRSPDLLDLFRRRSGRELYLCFCRFLTFRGSCTLLLLVNLFYLYYSPGQRCPRRCCVACCSIVHHCITIRMTLDFHFLQLNCLWQHTLFTLSYEQFRRYGNKHRPTSLSVSELLLNELNI